MKHIKVFELSEADYFKLEKGYHNGHTHNHCIRCKSILLKSSGKWGCRNLVGGISI